ncbi:hypothetical protein RB195_024125 [Necator americanus]|uniref:Integrase catalytic domain-containing protein n=1 Tax=Necator americanus TaxID=51031 RepID=A0ABR1EM16_NECAM
MVSDIEKLVRTCPRCASVAKDLIKAEVQSWPKPHSPWTRVHADFAESMEGLYCLLIVDAYSKWPEIVQMSSISSTATIQAIKCISAEFGNPETLITDNGTQFTSSQFTSFCLPEESCTFTRRHSIHKASDKQNVLWTPSKEDLPR